MKTKPSRTTAPERNAWAVVLLWLVTGPVLVAQGLATADEPMNQAPSGAPEVCGPCMADDGIARVFVRLECPELENPAARLSPRATRAPGGPARRLQLEMAGLDLLASEPGELRPAALTTAEPSPFDFAPGARTVGPLRWAWVSVTWKF